MVKYLGPADPHTSSIWATNDPGGHNESILFDKSGNAYIGQPDGTHNIIKRDASGGFLARYAPTFDARGTDWIDLAADQKTMLYTSEGAHVQRFDVSTNTQLSNFSGVLPGANAFALRILPDGTVLVADGNMVVHLAADGTVLHTYDTSNTFSRKTIGQLFSLNLDPNGLDFWTGDDSTNQVYAVNIATGAIDHTWNVGAGDFFGLAVFGEVTAGGGGGGGGGKVPEPATILLLGSGLVGLWGARKKFKK